MDPVDPPVKNGGTFTGYASGFVQTGENGTGEPQFLIDGTSRVVLNPEDDSVSADISGTRVDRVILPKTTTFNLGFRSTGPNAYVDDNIFLALGDDGSSSVVRSEVVLKGPWWRPRLETQVTNFALVNHTSPPNGGGFGSVPTDLCSKCDFLRYGFWVSDVSYGNQNLSENTDKMGGWWIGTNEAPISKNDMPVTGTARYEGLAVGTLAERAGNNHIWQQHAGATGKMGMDWNFGQRAGWLQINNFGTNQANQKSFGGPMVAPGRVDFAGPIIGSGGIGAARGSFVGSTGPQTIPKG